MPYLSVQHQAAAPVYLPLAAFTLPASKQPSYDDEVLKPLRAAQAAEAAAEAARVEARQRAEQEQAALDAQQAAERVHQAVVRPSGTCIEWLAAAGVTDIANAMTIINWESGCNPNAINPSSGACGVAQELPCGKSGCLLGDGACQVRWMTGYVAARYGTWANAVTFHISHGWY